MRIAFTYAALHGFNIMAADILNTYLQAPISEKYWTICDPEFGPDLDGCKAHIVRALYGTKSAGRDFRSHLRSCMETLGYESCLADPDLWLRRAIRSNGEPYYEYVLLYFDDVLCCSEFPKEAILEIDKYFAMKKGSIETPSNYLGGKVGKVQLPNGVEVYSWSMSQYVQSTILAVEKRLKEEGRKLPTRCKTPIPSYYSPETDDAKELNEDESNYYQSLIGILRWLIEMGRIDICTEVSMLSSYVVCPRDGHFEALLQIFAYLKSHHNARIVFDPSYPDIDEAFNERRDWSDFYNVDKEVYQPTYLSHLD